jgi:CRP-like cAMP-binding protein
MKEELKLFLVKFGIFSQEEITELVELLRVTKVEKGMLLVKEGQVFNSCFFVLKGCMRKFVVIEKTVSFFIENQAINFFTSYSNQTPSDSYLVAVEDSIILEGNPEKDAVLFNKFPKLEQLTRKMMEQDFGQTQDAFAQFITSSPQERYLRLLQDRPDLLQRIPQHQLASYLGITPESLSRIRRRVTSS